MQQRFRVINGDSLQLLNTFEPNSIDSCVCDPPYELGFMGKKWDSTGIANNVELWKSVLRVLKPGAHLVAFGGTRTYHRMACAIEDAGFEIRDQIGWVYGSGFPKSLDVAKAIDKANGAKREVIGTRISDGGRSGGNNDFSVVLNQPKTISITAPATEAAKKWNGWGTALKPAWEPIALARKPLIGTVAENVQLHGTGAINIDASRVPSELQNGRLRNGGGSSEIFPERGNKTQMPNGRWPANVIHDGSDEVLAEFAKFGESKGASSIGVSNGKYSASKRTAFQPDNREAHVFGIDERGTAARFFYCAKASKRDRDEGLNGFEAHDIYSEEAATPMRDQREQAKRYNNHPTVKPTALMRYLCKLITPPGGLILDPFTGSGSTGKAAMLEGFRFVGIELSPDYAKIARARISSSVLTKSDKKNAAKPL